MPGAPASFLPGGPIGLCEVKARLPHCPPPPPACLHCVSQLLEQYLQVEERFESGGSATEQEVIDALRVAHAPNLAAVLDIAVAHQVRLCGGLGGRQLGSCCGALCSLRPRRGLA